MSGYQKSKNKKEYAKSIILITPLDHNERILFEKTKEEKTYEDPNTMKFRNGNHFNKYFEEFRKNPEDPSLDFINND